MAKREYISRYLLIISRIKASPFITYKELQKYISDQFLFRYDEIGYTSFSKRTLQRDIREIREIFGVDIEYSRQKKGYFIRQDQTDNLNFQRMMETFEIFNSLNLASDLMTFIHLEKRKPLGTIHLPDLLHAIKNKLQITFTYEKYWENKSEFRMVDPYALKEFKNRWYLLAAETGKKQKKSFGLDRITKLEITSNKIIQLIDFDVNNFYKYAFGIITPTINNPMEIVLSFSPEQGKYIKSLPLHESQEVLVDNKIELQIKLFMCITFDFVMELTSYGETLKVLSPKSLVNKLKETHKRAYKRYT